MKINWKKIIGITTAIFGTTFIAVSVVARKKKGDSVYKNVAEQRNSMEGKKVIFIENEKEPENADGVRGHLEAVGDSNHKESFYETEQIISNAVKQGQHVYHAIKANNLPISTATVYRHINKQYYSIGRIDLPRAVKFKPRKTTAPEHIPACAKKGRTYQDFIGFM